MLVTSRTEKNLYRLSLVFPKAGNEGEQETEDFQTSGEHEQRRPNQLGIAEHVPRAECADGVTNGRTYVANGSEGKTNGVQGRKSAEEAEKWSTEINDNDQKMFSGLFAVMLKANTPEELADSIITDIETVKKVINGMIAICPNEMQGLCLTRSLITYYYEKNPDKLGSYIRLVEAKMMATLNNKPKNRFDLKCLFNDIQVKSSGILKEAKIILAIMHAMLKEDNIKKSKVSYLDCAIGLLAVLKKGKYWEKKTSTFTYMLRDLFNVDVNKGSVNAWFRRHGNDYTQWNHDISRGENIETEIEISISVFVYFRGWQVK